MVGGLQGTIGQYKQQVEPHWQRVVYSAALGRWQPREACRCMQSSCISLLLANTTIAERSRLRAMPQPYSNLNNAVTQTCTSLEHMPTC